MASKRYTNIATTLVLLMACLISASLARASSSKENRPPLLIQNTGIKLGYYDAATGRAGDLLFTQAKFYTNLLFTDYGYTVVDTPEGQPKQNPQPTFLAPLGTKVRSLISGIVVGVSKLYSNDYSVQVVKSKDSDWRYETEHVVNVKPKVGQRVKAGQVIAEVSPFDKQNNGGMGLVEIGILHGGGNGRPSHVCPFAYLDPKVKKSIRALLNSLYTSWETYRGDTTLYDQSKLVMPGCLTLKAIEG